MPGKTVENGVPVVKVKNLIGGRVDTQDLLLTAPEIDAEYPRSKLRAGDLLLAIRGTTGRLAITPPQLEDANITQDTARISIDNRVAQSKYVFFALQAPLLQRHIDLHTIGQAVRGINIAEVRKLPVPLPPEHEQQRIVEIFDAVQRVLDNESKKLSSLWTTKSGLLQDLLTGKVRVAV